MKAVSWLSCFALVGCGRIAFDPHGGDGGAGGGDDGSGAGSADALTVLPGAVAYFPFEDVYESGGTTYVDAINGQALALCIPPACPLPVAGHRGQAYRFNGSIDCAYVTNTPAFNTPLFTIAVWFDDEVVENASFVAKPVAQPSDLNSWQLEVLTNGALQLTTYYGGTTQHLTSASGLVTTNTWMHAAGTWDGSMERLYLNGSLVASTPRAGSIIYDTAQPIFACDNNSGDSQHLTGAIDDLWVFDRPLSLAEIQQLAVP